MKNTCENTCRNTCSCSYSFLKILIKLKFNPFCRFSNNSPWGKLSPNLKTNSNSNPNPDWKWNEMNWNPEWKFECFWNKKLKVLSQIKPQFSFWLKKDFRKMANNKHVDLKKMESFVRSKCYPEDISKDKGKKANFRKSCKNF